MNEKPGSAGPIFFEHWDDAKGNPAGGVTFGNGFCISWQNGPLGRGTERKSANGAFVEDIVEATIARIEFYQSGKFASEYNREALKDLRDALRHLRERTGSRELRGVEGTHAA